MTAEVLRLGDKPAPHFSICCAAAEEEGSATLPPKIHAAALMSREQAEVKNRRDYRGGSSELVS